MLRRPCPHHLPPLALAPSLLQVFGRQRLPGALDPVGRHCQLAPPWAWRRAAAQRRCGHPRLLAPALLRWPDSGTLHVIRRRFYPFQGALKISASATILVVSFSASACLPLFAWPIPARLPARGRAAQTRHAYQLTSCNCWAAGACCPPHRPALCAAVPRPPALCMRDCYHTCGTRHNAAVAMRHRLACSPGVPHPAGRSSEGEAGAV